LDRYWIEQIANGLLNARWCGCVFFSYQKANIRFALLEFLYHFRANVAGTACY
jgi:hypothetical protein